MWARVARFEGDPSNVDARIARLRAVIEGGELPPELAEAKVLMLVDRESGVMLGVTLFESEEALRRGDEVMNAGPGEAGSRSAVEFYEVPIRLLEDRATCRRATAVLGPGAAARGHPTRGHPTRGRVAAPHRAARSG